MTNQVLEVNFDEADASVEVIRYEIPANSNIGRVLLIPSRLRQSMDRHLNANGLQDG
jgi:hypothetical protein